MPYSYGLGAGSILKEHAVDFFGAIVNGLLTTVGYVVIFFGVYKLYQIATDIHEIKDLAANARRGTSGAAPVPAVAAPVYSSEIARDVATDDSAADYAANLLRAVNAGSQRTE
jgi:hypothetical protein